MKSTRPVGELSSFAIYRKVGKAGKSDKDGNDESGAAVRGDNDESDGSGKSEAGGVLNVGNAADGKDRCHEP